jgi:hypothetical protein
LNELEIKQEVLDALKNDKVGRSTGEGIGAGLGAIIGIAMAFSSLIPGVGLFWAAATIIMGMLYGMAVGAAIGGLIDPPKIKNPEFGNSSTSPRYGFGPLQTMSSNELPVPILYGQVKIAGNNIYQSDPATTVYRCLGLCEGEINAVNDVRINDIPITELSGCSYTAYMGTSTQTVDSRFSSYVDGLRYTAYLAMTLTASDKLAGGLPNITCVVDGMKVSTWNGSVWSTVKTYSNNPAACVRDFLTSTRYGVGLPESSIDSSSFGEVYDWCNGQVPKVGFNEYENRATLNYVIDGRQSAIDVLQDMLVNFSGFLVFSGNKIKLRVESITTVTQSFNEDTIIAGSLSYAKASKDDLPNRVRLQYIDPNYNWTKIFVEYNDIVDQEARIDLNMGESIVNQEISAYGTTGFSQASRFARTYLYLSKLCGTYITFQVGPGALSAEVGDTINVTHSLPGWTNKPFRILSIQHSNKDTLQLYAREYNSTIYSDDSSQGILVPDYGSTTSEFDQPNNPSALTTSEGGYINKSGNYTTTLLFGWTVPNDTAFISHYFIEYSKDSGDYYSVGTTSGTSIVLDNATEGSGYRFRVKSVTYKGLYSTGIVSSSYTALGKSAPPSNVTNFSVSFTTDSLLFSWTAVADADLYGYEIRKGSDWNTASLVDTGITNTRYLYRPVSVGTHTYKIKAIDTSGNYSSTEDTDTITITTAPDTNITIDDYISNEIQLRQDLTLGTVGGECSVEYTNGYDSSYNRETLCLRTVSTFGDYETQSKTYNEMQSEIIGSPIVNKGIASYISSVHDLGAIYNALTTLTLITSNTSGVTYTTDIKTSLDNITWGDWETWDNTQYYSVRYYQIRIIFYTTSTTQNFFIYDILFSVDVPDVWATDGGGGINIEVGGTTISYQRTFSAVPRSLIVTTVDKSSSVVAVVSSQTTTNFVCTLYDSTNTSVTGKINYFAKGY